MLWVGGGSDDPLSGHNWVGCWLDDKGESPANTREEKLTDNTTLTALVCLHEAPLTVLLCILLLIVSTTKFLCIALQ